MRSAVTYLHSGDVAEGAGGVVRSDALELREVLRRRGAREVDVELGFDGGEVVEWFNEGELGVGVDVEAHPDGCEGLEALDRGQGGIAVEFRRMCTTSAKRQAQPNGHETKKVKQPTIKPSKHNIQFLFVFVGGSCTNNSGRQAQSSSFAITHQLMWLPLANVGMDLSSHQPKTEA